MTMTQRDIQLPCCSECKERIPGTAHANCPCICHRRTKVENAEVLGREAFAQGKTSVPALDPRLMELLTGVKVGDGISILTAWSRGWHSANLAAPVE